MNCEIRIGSRCKGEKYFNQTCGSLRPWLCEERKKRDAAHAREKKRLILENPDYPEMGMGA